MVNTCVVCKQSNKKGRESSDSISFHRFPLNKDLREQWLTAIGRHGDTIRQSAFLCSDHFEETCFRYGSVEKHRILCKGAVPTKNLSNKNAITSTQSCKNMSVIEDTPSSSVEVLQMVQTIETPRSETSLVLKDYLDIFPSISNVRHINDITKDDIKNWPTEAQICWEVARETIDEQKKTIGILRRKCNRLHDSVKNLKSVTRELKKEGLINKHAESLKVGDSKKKKKKESVVGSTEKALLLAQNLMKKMQHKTATDIFGEFMVSELKQIKDEKVLQETKWKIQTAIKEGLKLSQEGASEIPVSSTSSASSSLQPLSSSHCIDSVQRDHTYYTDVHMHQQYNNNNMELDGGKPYNATKL